MATASYAERIRAARPDLSKSFQRLADYILDSYVQAALMTASELAHQVDVDSATVVRFAQALDYSGFPQLQDEIKARVVQELLLRPKESAEPDSLPALADRAFKELSEAMDRKRRMMDIAPIEALLKAVRDANRVMILADAQGQFIVNELSSHLQSVGSASLTLRCDERSTARGLALASGGDILLVIDMLDETPLLSAALAQAKTAGLRTAAIVGSASFAAAQRAEIVLEVQSQEQGDNAPVLLAAMVHALGSGLRWRFAEEYKQRLANSEKMLKRFAAAKPGRVR
ncbi:MAG: MurR/RpiR family transcriptional regulator [Anaerolineales bacterium]